MNKKISKIILVATIGAMIVTTVCIGFYNKQDYNIKDISGNREALGNVNLVYQKNQGYYKTSEVIISKDDIKVDNYAKGTNTGLPLNSYYKENRNLFNGARGKENIYKDDNTVGTVNLSTFYDNNNKRELIAEVSDKNLKTNKTKTYEILIDDKYNENEEFGFMEVTLKYNNEVYLMVVTDKGSIRPLGEESTVYGSKELLINIYKLDLEKETSELVVSRILNKKDELISVENNLFTYEDKFYFTKQIYKKVSDKEYTKSYELISYDLKTKKFNFINLPMDKNIKQENYYINRPYVEGDEVSFLSYEDIEIESEIHESNIKDYKNNEETKDKKSKDNKLEINLSTMNLKSNKFITENEKYTLKLANDKFAYYIQQIRDIDDKLYITFDAYKASDEVHTSGQLNKNYIYVIDKKTKETLYSGLIKDESSSYIYPHIIANDEL